MRSALRSGSMRLNGRIMAQAESIRNRRAEVESRMVAHGPRRARKRRTLAHRSMRPNGVGSVATGSVREAGASDEACCNRSRSMLSQWWLRRLATMTTGADDAEDLTYTTPGRWLSRGELWRVTRFGAFSNILGSRSNLNWTSKRRTDKCSTQRQASARLWLLC